MLNFGIAELYCGTSGKKGFYNNQEIGLSRAMKHLGYNCIIFYPSEKKSIVEESVEESIQIVRCPAFKIGVHARYDWSVIQEYKIDVLLVGADNQIFAPDLIRYCIRNNICVFNYIGTIRTDSSNRIKRSIMNIVYRRNIKVYRELKNFAKTEVVKKELINKGVIDVEIAPVGLDVSVVTNITEDEITLKKVCALPTDKIILLFVGRIDVYKHPERMIETIKRLDDRYFAVLIGDGALSKQIEETIIENKLEKKIKWIKKLPNSEIHKYYRAADYFLNFNDQEIFGMSILEALYHGCTVVAFHAPGPDMIIDNLESGFLVNGVDDVVSIVEARKYIEKSKAKDRVTSRFTWENTANIIDRWIEQRFKHDNKTYTK